MYVMFDTNVFMKGFHWRSFEFRTLLNNLNRLGITMVLNSFVIDETVEKYREKLIEYNAKTKNYQYLVPEYCSYIENQEIEKMVEKYRNFITYEVWNSVRMNVKICTRIASDLQYRSLFERCLNKKSHFLMMEEA